MINIKYLFLTKNEKVYFRAIRFCLSYYEKVTKKKEIIRYYPDLVSDKKAYKIYTSYKELFELEFVNILANGIEDFTVYEIFKTLGNSFGLIINEQPTIRKRIFSKCLKDSLKGQNTHA